mmetsp:Transcript_4398/g.4521  ORF Transcript_4398/g.4521 Transcript_4398/m.4521 type:complete len:308 (+) Transcript_4398:211-1134(+)
MEFICNELPTCPLYHPDSDLRSRSGYYPNINDVQLQAVRDLNELLKESSIDCRDPDEIYFLKLLRFLRARNFNVQKAYEMLVADVGWRNESNRKHLRVETSSEVLQCDPKLIYRYFPAWIQGYDKQCRPVAWRQFGKFEIWNILKLTTMERMVRFHAWEAEQALRLMHEQSVATGYNIETFILIIDAADWHIGLATMDAYTFIKGMATTDSDHNPERLGKMIVINAPTMLSVAWRVIQGVLDDVQKAKIKILSNQRDWLPELLEIIDIDQIPQQYGGNAPDPVLEDAFSSMEPPSTPPVAAENNSNP